MTKKKLLPGPHRVEAWIYGVINPLTEALEREVMLSSGRSPTYRWRTLSLERILPLRAYLSRGGGLIAEDLAGHDRGFVRLEKGHDALVEKVRSAAHRAFQALVEDPDFREFVEKHFTIPFDGSDLTLSDVAQDLVNDTAETVNAQAGTYPDAWNQHLPKLRSFRQPLQTKALNESLVELHDGSDRMLGELIEMRSRLVQEFDVPPAPLDL